MIKSIYTFKWGIGDNMAVCKTCGSLPVYIDKELTPWLNAQVEEVVTLNELEGKFYAKIETGPRKGKIFHLPSRVRAACLSLTQRGPAVVYSKYNDKHGELLLI